MSTLPTPEAGDIIAGRFQILEKLGEGGFGMIFRARQRQVPQEVAVKFLIDPTGRFDEEEMEQRFQRETLMGSKLRHPHTVAQYDYGHTEGGYRYIAMEYMRGQNLTQRIKETGPLPTELVIRIAQAVLEVLELGHGSDIVHRDLKPDNIMLCDIGGDPDFPKVLDFGAAKSTQGAHDITSAGITLGSPAYMAPEVLTGQPAVPASDLYSLGLTLAEAIIAQKLVRGKNPLDRARAQISPEAHPIPSALGQHSLYPWLRRAIDKDLSRRYSSAREMLDALRDHVNRIGLESSGVVEVVGALAESTQEMQALPASLLKAPLDDATEAIELPESLRQPKPPVVEPPTEPDWTLEPDEDPTEFLQNPLANLTLDESTSPTEALPAVPGPPPQPPSTPTPAPPPQVPAQAPPEPDKPRSFGKSSARRDGSVQRRKPDKASRLEPSMETDYRLIKTADKQRDWFTVELLIGGGLVIIFMLIMLRGLF